LHSTASQAPVARNILQDFVSTAPQGREYVRKTKRLAAYLNALRPLRPHILQRYLHRGNRYLLARSMSPDPSIDDSGLSRSSFCVSAAKQNGSRAFGGEMIACIEYRTAINRQAAAADAARKSIA
jgi:hypothetical protein